MRSENLENSVLCCILLKPELMEEEILEDKYFQNTQRVWQFMKAFYKKFKCFDIELMASVCEDNYRLMNYITVILESEATAIHFELYVKQLMEKYNEKQKDKIIIKKIFEYANNLYLRNISTSEFKKKVDEIYKESEVIKKWEEI